MKWLLFSFLVILFLTPLVIAEDFSIDVVKKDQYLAGYTDYITLKINNPLAEDWFTISLFGSEKWIYPETSSGLLKVPSMGSEIFKIAVQPPRDVIPSPNPYLYSLKITRVSTGSILEKPLLINIVQTTNAIIKDLTLSCTSCIDSVDLSGKVYNVGSKALDLDLIFKFGGQEKTLSIGKIDIFEKKEFQTTLSLKDMNPGDYSVEVRLVDFVGNNLYTESASFKIPVIENIVYDKEVSTTPFGSLITITAINKGNIVSDAELKSISPESWYYTISGPTPTGMMINGQYFWKTNLRPRESTNITYTEIYWPTYTLILFVVMIGVFMYWQSTAFVFRKEVIGRQKAKFGRNISVSLHLRSRRKEIGKVAVRDIVPSKFSIVSKFDTVKPIIRKIADGVELVWRIGDLKPYEERVLHYTVRPTSEFARKVHLPSALVKAIRGKSLVVKHSNRVALYPEEEEVKIVSVKVTK